MLHEDQYMERTPDLVARIRKMREEAVKKMNRFTCITDYDARGVIGQKPKVEPVSGEPAPSFAVRELPKKRTAKSSPSQISIEFAPAAAEPDDVGESS